jgi:hypothetical protein
MATVLVPVKAQLPPSTAQAVLKPFGPPALT